MKKIVRRKKVGHDWVDIEEIKKAYVRQLDHSHHFPSNRYMLTCDPGITGGDVSMIGGEVFYFDNTWTEFQGFVQGERGSFEDRNSDYHLERWTVTS